MSALGGQEAIVLQGDTTGASQYTKSLFTKKISDQRFKKTGYLTATPKNTLDNAERVCISIPKQDAANLINLSSLRLVVEMEVINYGDEEVSVINNTALSLIKDMQMWVGKQLVTPRSNHYDYRAYIEQALSLSVDQKSTLAALYGWSTDYPGAGMEDAGGVEVNSDSGFFTRKKQITETKTFFKKVKDANGAEKVEAEEKTVQKITRYITPLITDFTGTNAELLNGVSIDFEFTLNSPDFVLSYANDNKSVGVMGNAGINYKLHKFELQYKTHELTDHEARGVQERLNKDPFLVEYRRREIFIYNINAGKTVAQIENPFAGEMPCRALVGFVRSRAHYGKPSMNPYNFAITTVAEGAKLEKMTCTLNGPPLDGLVGSDMDANYLKLYNLLGWEKSNQSPGITREMFLGGYGFFALDFSTSLEAASDAINPSVRTGTVRLEPEFDKPLTEDVTMVLFAEYPSRIAINKDRQVSVDYVFG